MSPIRPQPHYFVCLTNLTPLPITPGASTSNDLVTALGRMWPGGPAAPSFSRMMTLHRLTAGDGYLYLIRQAAALEAARPRRAVSGWSARRAGGAGRRLVGRV